MTGPTSISGTGCLSCLGSRVEDHLDALTEPPSGFRPLGEMDGCPEGFETFPAAWIEPRARLAHRKWSPNSVAAIEVARQAISAAGWSPAQLRGAALFFGTSRGSSAGWLVPWPGRRAFARMAASNSLPAEPAAAIADELGVGGPWQVVSSGCCAGLDALGMADLWLRSGQAERALAVAVDLPLTAPVLESYARTGMLASPGLTGMVPAEGAAAVTLERHSNPECPRLLRYQSVSEPGDPLGQGKGSQLLSLLRGTRETNPAAVIPHASGTAACSQHEPAVIQEALGPDIPIVPVKPWTGHTIGASGLLEAVIACECLRRRQLPGPEVTLPPGSILLKIASAMGGKHSLVSIQSPT